MLKFFSDENKTHFFSSLMPATLFGIVSGAVTASVVVLFQWAAGWAVSGSETVFLFLRKLPFFLPAFALVLTFVAVLMARLYRRHPQLQGGGIPTAVGAMRGSFSLKPLSNLVGVFFLSLLSFFLGVPLGTEGPSVQMGAAVGGEIVKKGPEKWHAWERFSLTGGASAGFSVATGAPLSGILFSIEEAHGRISPLIVFTALWSVLSAGVVKSILSPLMGVGETLFSLPSMPSLSVGKLLLALALGVLFALFAVVFLKFSAVLDGFFTKKLAKFSSEVKILAIFLLTLAAGVISFSFVSTGHHFTVELFENKIPFLLLLAALVLRCVLTLCANRVGITGGIFLPLIAIGAAFAALVGKAFLAFGLSEEYFPLIVSLGICACIAGMMQMPLTAVFFSVEALGLEKNLPAVILIAAVSYFLSAAFGEKSVSELALERKEEQMKKGKVQVEEEFFITVEENSFAVGKEVRDIFWPQGALVLSVKKKNPEAHLLCPEDRVLVRIVTPFPEKAKAELGYILQTKQS